MKNLCVSILMAFAAATANSDHTLNVKQNPDVAIEGRSAYDICTADDAAPCFFVIDPGAGLSTQEKAAPLKSHAAGLNAITGWGDSLTVGGQDHLGGSYLKTLSALSGRPVNNGGAGGQT
jgi:hypothetical protein